MGVMPGLWSSRDPPLPPPLHGELYRDVSIGTGSDGRSKASWRSLAIVTVTRAFSGRLELHGVPMVQRDGGEVVTG